MLCDGYCMCVVVHASTRCSGLVSVMARSTKQASNLCFQAPNAVAEKAPEAPPSALNPNEWKAFKVQSIDTGGPPNTSRYRSCVTVMSSTLPAQHCHEYCCVSPLLLCPAILKPVLLLQIWFRGPQARGWLAGGVMLGHKARHVCFKIIRAVRY